jgi:hypothetical protein
MSQAPRLAKTRPTIYGHATPPSAGVTVTIVNSPGPAVTDGENWWGKGRGSPRSRCAPGNGEQSDSWNFGFSEKTGVPCIRLHDSWGRRAVPVTTVACLAVGLLSRARGGMSGFCPRDLAVQGIVAPGRLRSLSAVCRVARTRAVNPARIGRPWSHCVQRGCAVRAHRFHWLQGPPRRGSSRQR